MAINGNSAEPQVFSEILSCKNDAFIVWFLVDIGTGRIDYGKIYAKGHDSFNSMAVDNAKKLFFLPTVNIGKIGDRDQVPEKSGILISKGISIEGLHPGKKALGKIWLENQVFMSLANIGKTGKETVRLVKRIITLEASHAVSADFMEIPGRKAIRIVIIINDCTGIMDLEEGIELVSE